MKKVLIISPHFPPSNLAAVHRARLFAKHLPYFGWQPIILTVDEKYYEELPDYNLIKLLPENLRIEKVTAFKPAKPRLAGDIGLRAFFQLYKKASQLIKKEKFDFLYIPVPSFYVALLGRWLHATTGIKYGIDYIDPWVHYFPGSDRRFSRHWFSTKMAKWLEPIAVKKASLITGVAEGYYSPVLDRNLHLKQQAVSAAIPYGGEAADHEMVNKFNIEPYLFKKNKAKLQLVYAGAMLPKAYKPLEKMFESIRDNMPHFYETEFHFIGTGSKADDPFSYNIKPLAVKYNLWNTIVIEYPQRIPYADVLIHLNAASGVFILGSTEPHYTPSKVYQAVLSKKPIWAILHNKSTACKVIRQAGAGIVIDFNGENDLETIFKNLPVSYLQYKNLLNSYDYKKVNQFEFEKYSAKNITGTLALKLDIIYNAKSISYPGKNH